MKIKQISVDSTVIFFRKELLERYPLKDYYSETDPALFFGIWNQVEKINNHKGYKVVYLASPKDGEKVRNLFPSEKLFIKEDKILYGQKLVDIPNYYQKKHFLPETKNYDKYFPTILGTKVYAYCATESRKHEFQFELVKQIEKKIDFEIIYGIVPHNTALVSMDYIRENWYNNCFINLNLSLYNGLQTVFELSYMGRKTIANFFRPLPCVINYTDLENIVTIINEESKKIGTLQPKINCHTVNEEWLDIEWWKQSFKHEQN